MSTKLGDVTKTYGKEYKYVVTNLTGADILASDNLIENSLIISAPNSAKTGIDIGTYSIFATDANGNAARLTYTIQPGNGIVVGANGELNEGSDILSLGIDDDSIQTDSLTGKLFVNKENIIDNNTLAIDGTSGDITVIANNLGRANELLFGVVKPDITYSTISVNDGILHVETEQLEYVDDDKNVNGIVRHQPDDDNNCRTIEAHSGLLNVITQNLDKASATQLGVIQPDDVTVKTNPYTGVMSVYTPGLNYAYSYLTTQNINGTVSSILYEQPGIVKVDNNTIIASYNGHINVNTSNLNRASTTNVGVIMLDDASLEVTNSGAVGVKNYAEIAGLVQRFNAAYTYINQIVADLDNRVSSLENITNENIYSLISVSSLITTLDEPTVNVESNQIVSNTTYESVVFRISSNCKFKVAVEYAENISPEIVLQEVKFNNETPINASGLSQHTFDGTNENGGTLKFSFVCHNYKSENTDEKTTATQANFIVTSINNSAVHRLGVHTFVRYNIAKYSVPTTEAPTTEAPVYKAPTEPVLSHIVSMNLVELPSLDKKLPVSRVIRLDGANIQTALVSKNTIGSAVNYGLDITGEFTYTSYKNSLDITGTECKYTSLISGSTESSGTLENNKHNLVMSDVHTFTRGNDRLDWVEDATPGNWFGCTFTTYAVNGVHNIIQVYSKDSIVKDRKVEFTIKPEYISPNVSVDGVSKQITFVENMIETEPKLNIDLKFAKSSPYVTIDLTRSSDALMNGETWNTKIGLKYNYLKKPNRSTLSRVLVEEPFFVEISAPSTQTKISYIVPETVVNADGIDRLLLTSVMGTTNITLDSVDTMNSFSYGSAAISYQSIGVLPELELISTASFGNAKITNVIIAPWSDESMIVKFTLVPGTTTTIPQGATINELITGQNGTRKFQFVIGTSVYDYTDFYSNCTVTSTTWDKTTGCVVTYKFTNNVSTYQTTTAKYSKSVYYETPSGYKKYQAYTDIDYTKNDSLSSLYRQSVNSKSPVLRTFNAIRFWVGFSASYTSSTSTTRSVSTASSSRSSSASRAVTTCVSSMNYEVAVKVTANISDSTKSRYLNSLYTYGYTCPVSLVNVLYSEPVTTTKRTTGGGGGGGGVAMSQDYYDNLANSLNRLSSALESGNSRAVAEYVSRATSSLNDEI